MEAVICTVGPQYKVSVEGWGTGHLLITNIRKEIDIYWILATFLLCVQYLCSV
jgi:hypothetical protein